MIELAQHIEALLLENDCVIVPGLGGFVAHYAPAVCVKEENLFLPPARTIGFNPQLKLNDGILVQSYMSVYGTGFTDATRLVEQEVSQFTALLHEQGKVALGDIGELRCNIYGDYEFTPYDNKLSTPSLYGLDSFEMSPLSALERKDKVWIPDVPAPEKKTFEISINRAYLRNVAAIAVAVVLFFAFSTRIENTDLLKNNYAQLLPGQLFEQMKEHSVAMAPVAVAKQGAPSQQHKTAATKTAAAQKPTSKVTAGEAKTSKPITVKEVKVTPHHPFHIIVAGGISSKNAEELEKRLKEEGFPQTCILRSDGKIRVSIGSYDNREEATRKLLEIRKNATYKDAWLLVK